MKAADLTGQRFGRLVAVARLDDRAKRSSWQCLCDCGNTPNVQTTYLKSGHTRSCGCLRGETSANRKHGMSNTPIWRLWKDMIRRCTDPSRDAFQFYGGRGIRVCERWQQFENFFADMGMRPDGKTLDRWPNNDGNYEPGNCRWATPAEQSNNRRQRRRVKTACVNGHPLPPLDRPYKRCARCHADEEKARRDAKRVAEAA